VPTHTGRQRVTYTLVQRPFAGGGEGDIYEITNASHLVAKKYKPKKRTTERE
jgi:DNA-binding helix-hairpin-helix protein with protein kinase domain